MAITEHTRICEYCAASFEHVGDSLAACPKCGRHVAPREDTWPPHLKRYLTMQTLLSAIAAMRKPTKQALWERVLLNRMRGRWVGNRRVLLPQAATAAECYEWALREADEWRAAGSPDLTNFDQPEQAPAKRIA